jgi:hypothetical protein
MLNTLNERESSKMVVQSGLLPCQLTTDFSHSLSTEANSSIEPH